MTVEADSVLFRYILLHHRHRHNLHPHPSSSINSCLRHCYSETNTETSPLQPYLPAYSSSPSCERRVFRPLPLCILLCVSPSSHPTHLHPAMKMQPIHLVASLLLTVTSVQAETTTSTPAAVTPTNLPDLIASLPHCALGCLSDAATAINCAPTNFTCLCAESKALISNLGPCILTGGSGCKPDEISGMDNGPARPCPFCAPWRGSRTDKRDKT